MRFHAVVLQTMLNGNNYILDYTDPSIGKIVGMLRQMKIMKYYEKKYFSLYTNNKMFMVDLSGNDRFEYDKRAIDGYFDVYVDCLKKC